MVDNKVKDDAIQEYCETIDCVSTGRRTCKLGTLCDACHGDFMENPDILDKAFAIVNGEDAVHHPSHYTQGGMECIDEMVAVFGNKVVANFCLGNVWKYRKRALFKNGKEDLEKADWYMKKYVELSEKRELPF